MLNVSVVLGTRPEAIKLLPVADVLRQHPAEISCRVVATGQHRELLDQVFHAFGMKPDVDLDLMEEGQTLENSFARALLAMTGELTANPPDLLLVEGDTTTVLAGSLAAFWRGCPVGHVEAGLRSGDVRDPFPEEMNRILTDCVADLHFAPTRQAAENLRRYGVPASRIFITGNTVIDALQSVAEKVKDRPLPVPVDPNSRILLVTVHRRESFGEPLRTILGALNELVLRFPDVEIVLPVHPNPQVHGTVHAMLGGQSRVHLVAPLTYMDFVALLRSAYLVLTDSGGVQEEAPALGKPVLVLRNTTERPEGVAYGVAELVGTRRDRIVGAASRLLEDSVAYNAMARTVNPYGDGAASRRTVEAVLHHVGLREERPADFVPVRADGMPQQKESR